MARYWDQAELERYVAEGIEENLTLDYKAGDALIKSNGRRSEIAKDISAMANSAGGVIIYGIGEHTEQGLRYKPAGFSPADRRQCSKETLEQIISSNIHPRISGIKIHPVPLNTGPNHVAYVVSIPPSDTVHQVVANKRYYKRFNFESVPMEDYEIRDVFNRTGQPEIETRIGHMTRQDSKVGTKWAVPIFVKNKSLVVAKDTTVTVELLDQAALMSVELIRFQVKTQMRPSDHDLYIASFPEAIHRGLNKYFGTLLLTIDEPKAIGVKLQVFANGMRAKWWRAQLNLATTSATIQIVDEGFLY